MVAITVILAAVIGTFVLGLGENVESAPQASFNFDGGDGDDTITVTHRGGDTIESDNIEVRATLDTGNQASFDSPPTRIRAGDSVDISQDSTGDFVSGDEINIVYTGGSGDSIIASYTVP